jgi:hypothetical protein
MAVQGYLSRSHIGGLKTLTGSITLGSAAIASETLTGRGIASSVVRNSAGDYTITLTDPVGAFEYIVVNAQIATAADIKTQITATSVANKTVQFRTLAVATPTDAASGSVLYVKIIVREML